jgi:glycosyltransferase 2 family protein
MRRIKTRGPLIWIGVAVSAAFAYLALRDVDFNLLRTALARSDHWILAPAGAILGLAVYLRALRWRVLFPPGHRPSTNVVTSALLIGYFFNTTLPARAGEAARVVALNQRASTSRFEALGTVVAERALDVLALLAILFAAAPFLPRADWLPRSLELGAAIFVVLAIAGIVFAVYGRRAARLLLRPLAALPGISRDRTETGAANLVSGFALFRQSAIAVPASGLTVASWLLIALSYWLVLRGFHLDLGFEAGLLVVVATNLALILPSGPAAIGVFEAATVAALLPFDVGRTTALSYAILLHALNALPFIVVGYAALHHHASAVRRADSRRHGDPLETAPERQTFPG